MIQNFIKEVFFSGKNCSFTADPSSSKVHPAFLDGMRAEERKQFLLTSDSGEVYGIILKYVMVVLRPLISASHTSSKKSLC